VVLLCGVCAASATPLSAVTK